MPLIQALTLTVTQLERADLLLLAKLRESAPALSRARLKDAVNRGEVLIQGSRFKGSDLLSPGQYEVSFNDWDPLAASNPQAKPSSTGAFLPILYEDAQILVLQKSSGVPSVPHSPDEDQTAVNSALASCPALRDVGRGGLEPGLLHRLDTGTSGLLAFAKSNDEYSRLTEAWKTPAVRKIYRAVAGPHDPARIPKIPGKIELKMAHDARSSRRMRVFETESRATDFRGKPLPAITTLLKCVAADSLSDYEIEIETGVMHQIRCTLQHLGCPILGDDLYGGEKSSRLWLHAWKLSLPLFNGQSLTLEAPLPQDWPTLASHRSKC